MLDIPVPIVDPSAAQNAAIKSKEIKVSTHNTRFIMTYALRNEQSQRKYYGSAYFKRIRTYILMHTSNSTVRDRQNITQAWQLKLHT